MMNYTKPFRILSIDGGGYRGLFAAHLLKRIEQEWAVSLREKMGILAGTSTGSILAAGLACGQPAEELAGFYTEHGPRIFSPRRLSRGEFFALLASRYSSHRLKAALDSTFGDRTLGDVDMPLILPAVDIGNGCVHVFKSKYRDSFVRDPGVRVADAVLASCSAPTYFDPVVVDSKYQLADGGLWANNPALAAAIDAKFRLGVSLDDMQILSIGTGKARIYYRQSKGPIKDLLFHAWQGWGLATRWHHRKLLDLILNLQSDTAHNMLCLLIGESPLESRRVLRLTFESDRPLSMDSVGEGADWITRADHAFTHYAARIKDFLAIKE